MALGDISNPMVADIAGALSYRDAQLEKAEQKRKDLRTRQLISEAIPSLPEGHPIRELMLNDPNKGAAVAQALGIPLNRGDQMAKFSSDVATLSRLSDADPHAAYEQAKQLQAEYKDMGMPTGQLDKWVGMIDQATQNNDNQTFTAAFNALHVMNNALNPVGKKEAVKLGVGETLIDPTTGKQIASGGAKNEHIDAGDRILVGHYDEQGQFVQTGSIAKGSSPKNPNDPANQAKVHSGAILPDGTTVSLMSDGSTQVQSADGQLLTGADRISAVKQARQYGVDIAGSTAGSKKTAESEAGVVSTAKQSENRAAQLSAAIDEAEKLLPKATGSYLGAATDIAGRVVGITTESSQASAKLDTLAGWMTANVPRMEGPQSDKDVQSYQTMAATVGDRTRPIAERQAALSVLKSLQEKYSGLNKNIIGGEQNTFGTKTASNQSAADRLKALKGGQ